MLDGYDAVSSVDVEASLCFLDKIKTLPKWKAGGPCEFNYALDCGGGIGRVSKECLLHRFQLVRIFRRNTRLLSGFFLLSLFTKASPWFSPGALPRSPLPSFLPRLGLAFVSSGCSTLSSSGVRTPKSIAPRSRVDVPHDQVYIQTCLSASLSRSSCLLFFEKILNKRARSICLSLSVFAGMLRVPFFLLLFLPPRPHNIAPLLLYPSLDLLPRFRENIFLALLPKNRGQDTRERERRKNTHTTPYSRDAPLQVLILPSLCRPASFCFFFSPPFSSFSFLSPLIFVVAVLLCFVRSFCLSLQVDLVEPVEKFLSEARGFVNSERLRDLYQSPLQTFTPAKKYDCLWIQWCILYLTDGDLVDLLRKARRKNRRKDQKENKKEEKTTNRKERQVFSQHKFTYREQRKTERG